MLLCQTHLFNKKEMKLIINLKMQQHFIKILKMLFLKVQNRLHFFKSKQIQTSIKNK